MPGLLSILALMPGWQKMNPMLRAPRLGEGPPQVVLRQENPPPFFRGSEVPFRKYSSPPPNLAPER